MTLDFNQEIKDLDNNSVDGILMSKLLAKTLSQASSQEPIKLWEMALKLNQTGILELDSTDTELLVNTIKQSTYLNVMSKAQILLLIKNTK